MHFGNGSSLFGAVFVSALLLGWGLSHPATANCTFPLADINNDETTNVADVQCGILVALWSLGDQDPAMQPGCVFGGLDSADVNCIGGVDVSDVLLVIEVSLGLPLDPALDEDLNGCPDGCEEVVYCTLEFPDNCEACPPGMIPSSDINECVSCPAGTYQSGFECTACPDGLDSIEQSLVCELVSPAEGYLGPRDYGFLFWPTNHWFQWMVFFNEQYVQTGYYGLSIDVSQGSLTRLGVFQEEWSAEEASQSDKELIAALPSSYVTYSVIQDGQERMANAFLSETGGTSNPSRLIDMGRFMQRLDIPTVHYEGESDVVGSLQLSAMPRYFVLSHRAVVDSGGETFTLRTRIGGDALSAFSNFVWLEAERALTLEDDDGNGWSFILPDQTGVASHISVEEDGSLLFEMTYSEPSAGEQLSIPIIAVPTHVGDENQLDVWLYPDSAVLVESAQMNLDGTGGDTLEAAPWDPERGLYVVPLKDLSEVGAPGWQNWADLSIHNWYNRHRIVISNNTNGKVSVPLAFEGGNNAAFYIVGGSPLFRDLNQEPVGLPIQISKNWHEVPFWYHLYSSMLLAPGAHEMEHTFAHSKWGNAYAAAHAQLALIGCCQNQQWDESSLGAFGESITYDPDWTLGRSMVDDVRPFLVQTKNKWNWTGNVGGANFLVYRENPSEPFPGHTLGRLRTHYRYTGPNLTEVVYAGISRDDKIEAKITTHLGRTDDLVRAYYHLEYTFLEDVTYDRLALFQVAADKYSDNGFTRYAYGNEAEVTFDEDVPDHKTKGYATNADRGIPLPGESPWIMLYDSVHTAGDLPEHFANVGYIVRSYEATIGDDVITTPHINIVRTYNQNWSQMGFELGIPFNASNPYVPAGSVLKATVEYVIPPSMKSAYYGPSEYLNAFPAESFQSTEMIQALAVGNHQTVETSTGELVGTYPIVLDAEAGTTPVQFTLTGGLGFTPVVIKGLPRADGWKMERKVGGLWEPLSQAVHGNDYWQAHHAVESNEFELIYNLYNVDTQEYRLTR